MKSIVHRASAVIFVALLLGATITSQAQESVPLDRKVGQIFAAIGKGQYQVWDFSGTPTVVETITNGTLTASNAGCAFDSTYHPFTADVSASDVFRDIIDDPQTPITSGNFPINVTLQGGAQPTSIAFDSLGNSYIGIAGGNGLIEEYGPTGAFVKTYPVKATSPWIDLSVDAKTIYFTNGSNTIYQDSPGKNGMITTSRFASISGATLYALRVLTPAEQSATGGLLLVAAVFTGSSQIYLLDGNGKTVAPSPYTVAGENNLQVLTLDPDGKHFWVGSPASHNFFEIDFATGTPSVAYNTAAGGPNGLCAYGGFSAAQGQPTSVADSLFPSQSTANTKCTSSSNGSPFNCTFSTALPPPAAPQACPANLSTNCFSIALNGINPASLPPGGMQLVYNYSQIAQAAGTSDAGLLCDLTSPDDTKCEVHSIDVTPNNCVAGPCSSTGVYAGYDLAIHTLNDSCCVNPDVLKNGSHRVTDFQILGDNQFGGSDKIKSVFTVNEQPIAVTGQASCGWISPLINSQYNQGRTIPFKFQGAVSFSDCPSPSSTQVLTNLMPFLQILQANSLAPGATTGTPPHPVPYALSDGTQCPAIPGCPMRPPSPFILNVDSSSLPVGTYFGSAYDTNTPPQIPSFSYTQSSQTQTDFFTVVTAPK